MHSIVAANRYLTLATCSNNEVWAAPIAYAYQGEKCEFYFYSSVASKHARHIAVNSDVALTIFDSTAPSDLAEGLQIKARAHVVEGAELSVVLNFYFEKSFPDVKERQKWKRSIECFSGDAPQ